MEELRRLLEGYLNEHLIRMVLSGSKGAADITKISIRPVLLKGKLLFQAELFRGTKVFHENLDKEEAVRRILEWMDGTFRQLQLTGQLGTASVLVSKKGRVTVRETKQEAGVKEAVSIGGRASGGFPCGSGRHDGGGKGGSCPLR